MNKGIFQTKLRTGDEVIVIAGKDLGKKGTLREILKSRCVLALSTRRTRVKVND